MAAQKGLSVLLKVEATPGGATYNAIGGQRVGNLSINNEMVDITNKDSSGRRQLLDGAGVNSLSLSCSGVFLDDTPLSVVRAAALANTQINFKMAFPGGTAIVYTGAFLVTKFEFAGEYNGEMTYSIDLESAGAITVGST